MIEKIGEFLCRIGKHKWYPSFDCRHRWCKRKGCKKRQHRYYYDTWVDV